MQSQFQLGQVVSAPEFTDCFGKPALGYPYLIVTDVRLIDSMVSMRPYYRVTARNRWEMVEGAERFFVDADPFAHTTPCWQKESN
jgi:hypothetical protein